MAELNMAVLIRKRTWWRIKESAAHTNWRRYVATGKQSQKRTDAYNAWVDARNHRRSYDARISKFDIIHVSDKGEDQIISVEGDTPWAYNDSRGFATAWIGHLLHNSPVTAADLKKWGSRQHPAPEDKVHAFFKKDLAQYEAAVASVWGDAIKAGHPGPTQEQFDADVSFCFNIGIGGFKTSNHAQLIRTGANRIQTGNAMLGWLNPPEIEGRRRKEVKLFNSGVYSI